MKILPKVKVSRNRAALSRRVNENVRTTLEQGALHPAGEMGTYQPKVGALKILFKTQIKYKSSLHLSILKLLLPLPFYIPKGTRYSRTGQSSKRGC